MAAKVNKGKATVSHSLSPQSDRRTERLRTRRRETKEDLKIKS